jgi:hypothetical protein
LVRESEIVTTAIRSGRNGASFEVRLMRLLSFQVSCFCARYFLVVAVIIVDRVLDMHDFLTMPWPLPMG